MKILQITAGTGSFYCGTCIRDNAAVAALKKLGHDVLMLPLYLPTMILGARAAERASTGLDPWPALALSGAVTLVALAAAPFAAAAALRVNLR